MTIFDQTVFAPFFVIYSLFSITYLETYSHHKSIKKVKAVYWETLYANWKIWPFT